MISPLLQKFKIFVFFVFLVFVFYLRLYNNKFYRHRFSRKEEEKVMYKKNNNEYVAITPVEKKYLLTKQEEALVEEVAAILLSEFSLNRDYKKWKDYILTDNPSNSSCMIHGDDYYTEDGIIQKFQPKIFHLCSRSFTRSRNQDIVLGVYPLCVGYNEYLARYLDWENIHYFQVQQNLMSENLGLFRPLLDDTKAYDKLVKVTRIEQDFVIHPYQGILSAWKAAALLKSQGCHSIKVLAPIPKLADIVNEKHHFCSIVQRLLGKEEVIDWAIATSIPEIFQNISKLSGYSSGLAIRIPNLVFGFGTLLLTRDKVNRTSKDELHNEIFKWIDKVNTIPTDDKPFLITRWEEDVLVSPSVHLWIPPKKNHEPMIEGVFDQSFSPNDPLTFQGSRVSQLPVNIIERVERAAFLLGCLFQKMFYVGRCSFDLIVCGKSFEKTTIKFVECNGRWGGTSIPMSFMNRVFGDYRNHPYVAGIWKNTSGEIIQFEDLISKLDDILYNVFTKRGWVILYNPGALSEMNRIYFITLGSSYEEALYRQGEFSRIAAERCYSDIRKIA